MPLRVPSWKTHRHPGFAQVPSRAKGDNTAAVIMLNVVEGDHFKETGEVTRDELAR